MQDVAGAWGRALGRRGLTGRCCLGLAGRRGPHGGGLGWPGPGAVEPGLRDRRLRGSYTRGRAGPARGEAPGPGRGARAGTGPAL